MKNLTIYCTTIKYFKVLEKLPIYIHPVGLGDGKFPEKWLTEKVGENISYLNKYYAEFSMFYWIWKNRISNSEPDDLVGSCQHRYFFLDKKYDKKNYFSIKSLYSKLLKPYSKILLENDVIQLNPIIFKKKNLLEDFKDVHDKFLLDESLFFLDKTIAKNFKEHLLQNKFYSHNMFITKVKFFKEYCEIIFPWLEKVLNYCLQKGICSGYNTRLPAFLAERFSSFWFNQFKNRGLVSMARLGKFFLNDNINKFINPLKLPFTFRQFPTIHKY